MTQKGVGGMLALAFTLTACGQPQPSHSIEAQSAASAAAPGSLADQGWDGELAGLARQYPAFAGYREEGNQLILMVAKYRAGQVLPESERGRRVGQVRKALLDLLVQPSSPQLDSIDGKQGTKS